MQLRCPYLVPFFFEKVFLTLRCRLLSSRAAKPPLSRVMDSSTWERPLPGAEVGPGPDVSGRRRQGPRSSPEPEPEPVSRALAGARHQGNPACPGPAGGA